MAKFTETEKRVKKALKEVIDAHYTRAASEDNVLQALHLQTLALLNLEVKAKAYRDAMRDLDADVGNGIKTSFSGMNRAKAASEAAVAAYGVDDFVGTAQPVVVGDQGLMQMTSEEVSVAKSRGYIVAVLQVQKRLGCSLQEARDLVEATIGVPDFSIQ